MEKTILGNLEWQYVFLVRFITASMSDPKRERMSKKKSSQVHCISSHDHILMMASTSKHIPEIRLYKAWKGNNVFTFLFLTSARDPGIIPRNKTSVNLEDSSNSSLTQSMEILISRFLEQKTFSLTATLSKSSSVRLVCSTVHHVHQTAPYITTVSNALITIPGRLWSTMSHDIISVILIIYSFVSIWFVGGLTIFHVYLMSTNQTTYENFRSRYDKKENPYKRGLLKNVKEVLFAKIPPSQLDLRAMVPEEDDESEYESEYSSSIRYDNEKGGKLPKRVSPKKLNLDNIGISNEYKTAKDDASSELDPSFFSSQLDLPK
ncbi:hypothetical protein YC2023_088878 [Brassica napus]